MLTGAAAWFKVTRTALPILKQRLRARTDAEIDGRIEAGCSQVETFYTALLEAELSHPNMKDPHNLLPASVAPSLPEMATLIYDAALKDRKIKTKQLEPYVQDLVVAMYEDRVELVVKLWDKWIKVVPGEGGAVGDNNVHRSFFTLLLAKLKKPSTAWFCKAEGCRDVHWLVSAMAHAAACHGGSVETMVGVSKDLMDGLIRDMGKNPTSVRWEELLASRAVFCKSCPSATAGYGTFPQVVSRCQETNNPLLTPMYRSIIMSKSAIGNLMLESSSRMRNLTSSALTSSSKAEKTSRG